MHVKSLKNARKIIKKKRKRFYFPFQHQSFIFCTFLKTFSDSFICLYWKLKNFLKIIFFFVWIKFSIFSNSFYFQKIRFVFKLHDLGKKKDALLTNQLKNKTTLSNVFKRPQHRLLLSIIQKFFDNDFKKKR